MSKTHYKTNEEFPVINLKGTGSKVCTCGSWIVHWESFSGKIAKECTIKGCDEESVLGAHIKLYGIEAKSKDGEDLSNTHFIVPMCDSHNKRADVLILKKGVIVVKANISETCGR